jgi:hypothetical protein
MAKRRARRGSKPTSRKKSTSDGKGRGQSPASSTRVSPAVAKLLWSKSGRVCAFPDCRAHLVVSGEANESASIGEIAHIVAHSGEGPRSEFEPPGGSRDGDPNLLVLCPTHHTEIDRLPQKWTVERLIGIKETHERWVREQLSIREADSDPGPLIQESVHSSLLRVATIPQYVYVAPCALLEKDVRDYIDFPKDSPIALPFIVRGGSLMTFSDLTQENTPFRRAFEGAAEPHEARKWWDDPDYSAYYVTLLNRTLNKLTGRRGLNLDKEHHRYFFDPDRDEHGLPTARTIRYQPLNKKEARKSAVWQPKKKSTGAKRNYWIHLAVGLRFHRVTQHDWVLSVRPERRFTIDGIEPLVPKAIGRRSTSTKSHMYNYQLLGELQFWKEYLSNGQPAIILDFGGQSLVIDAELSSGIAEWPGVHGDVKPFGNTTRDMDLFSSFEYHRAVESNSHPDAELELQELDDLVVMEALGSGDDESLSDDE